MLPVARKEGLHIEPMAGELMVYDIARHKAHCLSPAAACVWRNCNGQKTAKDLSDELQKHGIGANEEMVWMILHRLSKLNLLERKVTLPENAILSTRRELMKRVGAVGGMFLLMTATIAAPTPAQARSGGGGWYHKPPRPVPPRLPRLPVKRGG